MHTFAQKPKASQQSKLYSNYKINGRAQFGQNHELNSSPHLQSTGSNQAIQRLLRENNGDLTGASTTTEITKPDQNFGRIPVCAKNSTEDAADSTSGESVGSSELEVRGERTFGFNLHELNVASHGSESMVVSEKSLDTVGDHFVDDPVVVAREPETYPGGGTEPAVPLPPAPANKKQKSAGVKYFEVRWIKGAVAGPTHATLRLEYTAKFEKSSKYDPALAEFRQSITDSWAVTAGPHAGTIGNRPMQDDNYSRADDLRGNSISDVDFFSTDNPGMHPLDKEDVIDYSFTAEQTIIDISDFNKIIETRGPHTATIKGKHPRFYDGVPITLS